MYPNVEIHLDKIIENAVKMKAWCAKQGIKLSVVTKLLADRPDIVETLVNNGIDSLCDSRIQNIINYSHLTAEKWLIREPMMSEIEDIIKYTDVSVNSESETIIALNNEAKKQNKIHKIVLMYELGDLREGCGRDEIFELVNLTLSLKNLELYGIGVNLCCYGGIIPTFDNMTELSQLASDIEEHFKIKLEIVSGGNSGNLKLLQNRNMPEKINNLRMGEAVFMGNIPCYEIPLDGFNRNNFVLNTQIVEIRKKPSVPRGTRYTNSFGEVPKIKDKGVRIRALAAFGKQDAVFNGLEPTDKNIDILGGSSDYIILDVTDSEKAYKVGDIVSFNMSYGTTLNVMTSDYVQKIIR